MNSQNRSVGYFTYLIVSNKRARISGRLRLYLTAVRVRHPHTFILGRWGRNVLFSMKTALCRQCRHVLWKIRKAGWHSPIWFLSILSGQGTVVRLNKTKAPLRKKPNVNDRSFRQSIRSRQSLGRGGRYRLTGPVYSRIPNTVQVGASVTRRPPYRPVREDFPHTVPRFKSFLPDYQPNRRHPVWRITLQPLRHQILWTILGNGSGYVVRKSSNITSPL
ncbi:hypothetical protein BuS5_01543 [Desulfosarcina sp. BuS5]|nr:hypothetical protein BuS5_01543 [Desulfosarcina sp. BuS5]